MHPTSLIEPAELAPHVTDPSWVVLDCRFELTRPAWGASAHAQGHIPGALHAHLETDLSGPISPATGRHPLPDPGSLAATLGAFGIDETVQVIAYDQGPGAYAARLWWLLRWLGHRHVAVLDGGFAAWQQAGLPTENGHPARTARRFIPRPHTLHTPVITTSELEQDLAAVASGALVLVDARSAERFRGENETIDPVGGHVPGAVNHPFTSNLDAAGRFLPPGALRRRFEQDLGNVTPEQVISMCGSGVTACHNLLAMELAGLPGARLYAGSWSEWLRDPRHPVARGSG
jgi:thiosulfate/3-mercaptopyruvate sulfurtransferase